MSFIRVENLYKIFGPKATQALEEVRGALIKTPFFKRPATCWA